MTFKTFIIQGFVFNISLSSESQIIPESGDEVEKFVWMVEILTPGGNTNTVKAQDFIDHGWNFLSPEFRGHLDHWSHIKDGVFAEFCSQFKTWLDTKWEKYKPVKPKLTTDQHPSKLKADGTVSETQSIEYGEWKFKISVGTKEQTVTVVSPTGSEEEVDLVALLIRGDRVLEKIDTWEEYLEVEEVIASLRQTIIKPNFFQIYPEPLKAVIDQLREEVERQTSQRFQETVHEMLDSDVQCAARDIRAEADKRGSLSESEAQLNLITEILLNSDVSESTRFFLKKHYQQLRRGS